MYYIDPTLHRPDSRASTESPSEFRMCGQKGVAVKSCSHPRCRDVKTWAGDKPAPFQMVMACATDNTFPYDSSVGPYPPRIRLEDWSPTPITQAPSAYP